MHVFFQYAFLNDIFKSYCVRIHSEITNTKLKAHRNAENIDFLVKKSLERVKKRLNLIVYVNRRDITQSEVYRK